MLRAIASIVMAALLLGVGAKEVWAQTATLEPVRTVVLPSVQGDDTTRVALVFDLSTLEAGEGRRIDKALLIWQVPTLSTEATAGFSVREITRSWDAAGVAAGTATVQAKGEAADRWEVGPRDAARGHRGMVVLNLRPMVESWAATAASNYGVTVATPDLTPAQLRPYLGQARLLLWYGFMK